MSARAAGITDDFSDGACDRPCDEQGRDSQGEVAGSREGLQWSNESRQNDEWNERGGANVHQSLRPRPPYLAARCNHEPAEVSLLKPPHGLADIRVIELRR